MISTWQADRSIAETIAGLERSRARVEVPIQSAIGRVLAVDIIADRDQPPFDRVAMDGIALALHDHQVDVPTDFRIGGRLAPGQTAPEGATRSESGFAIEVMTGAALPSPWNAVVPWEDLSRLAAESPCYRLRPHARYERGMNIHRRASDYRQGDILLTAGARLQAPDIHILASVGCQHVPVLPLPRIFLLATGDELVAVGATPASHQIRMSNMATIGACLERAGLVVLSSDHCSDRKDVLTRALARALDTSDVALISGAVSKGSRDFVPAVLSDLGCTRVFHGVAHKPGKPLWFGTSPQQGLVFALPGNPVSSLVCFVRYVLPHLRAWGQGWPGPDHAPDCLLLPLVAPVATAPDYTLLLPAEITRRSDGTDGLRVRKSGGSGNYAGLLPSHGIAEIPARATPIPEATPLRFFPWP